MPIPFLIAAATAAAAAGTAAGIGEATKHNPSGSPIDPDAFDMPDQIDPQTGQPINYGVKAHEAQGTRAASMRYAPGWIAPTISKQGQQPFIAGQRGLMEMLRARAAGEGQSAAELQMQAGQDRNVAAARSLAVSQQGVSPAMALRSAQESAAQTNIANTQETAILRAQEQAQAQAQYGQFLQGVRGQEMDLAKSQASLQQDTLKTGAQLEFGTMQANLQAEQQQRAMNNNMTQFYMQQGFARDQAQMMANMALQEMNVNQNLALQGLQTQASIGSQQFAGQMIGAGIQAIGSAAQAGGMAMAASDKNLKKKIKRSKKELDHFMSALKAYSYEYKDDKWGKGKRISPMAQDVAASELGKHMVEDTPEGKMVSYGKGLGTMLASVARLNERLEKVEGKKK